MGGFLDPRPVQTTDLHQRYPAANPWDRLAPLVGQYLSLIKDTSIVSMIGMSELMHQGQAIVDRIGQPVLIYGLVALLYFALCYPLSRWVQHQQTRNPL